MKSEKNIFAATQSAALVFCSALILFSCSPQSKYISISGYAQGGMYSVKVNMNGARLTAENLKTGIDSILLRIDNSLSGYNDSSLLSKFNRGERIVPNDLFMDIYKKGYDYYETTSGCVDVSAGALFDLWGFGFTSDSIPSEADIVKTLKDTGMNRLKKDMSSALDKHGTISAYDMLINHDIPVNRNIPINHDITTRKNHPSHPVLNYNAIAQGYSCDIIYSYLHSQGITDMLIDVGGEIFCCGYNPAGQPWSIGIDRPLDDNNVPGADLQGIFSAGPEPVGIVTSGNYRKYYVKEGKKYAHTIDPRTGYPVSHNLLCATLVCGSAAEADALATYCMVIGLEDSIKYISSKDDIEACLVYDEEGKLKTWTSKGLHLTDSKDYRNQGI